MTIFNVVFEAPIDRCEACGLISETEPYGLHHEMLCYDCYSKDPGLTEIRKKQLSVGNIL
jgi:hypothetical protein